MTYRPNITKELSIPITGYSPLQVSAEAVTIPAGVAGTLVDFFFAQKPILDSNNCYVGGLGDTSISFSSTTFDNEVSPFTIDANLANGDYWVDYATGTARGRKKDSGTSITATYYVAQGRTGGVSVADLSDWDNRPDGATDGEYGVGANGAIYRWDDTSSKWVANEAYLSGTLTEIATIIGTEDQTAIEALGYTVAETNGGVLTNATIGGRSYLTLNTSAGNSATCNISRSVTSGQGRYWAGYVQITNGATTTSTSAMIPYFRDGARIWWLNGSAANNNARFAGASGTPTGAFNNAENDLWTAPVWLEVIITLDGNAMARKNHESEWFAFVADNQMPATASTDEFLGDSSAVTSNTLNIAEFTTWSIS